MFAHRLKQAGFALALLALSVPALAADAKIGAAPPTFDYGWTYEFSLNAWMTALTGDVGVRGLSPAKVDISAWDAVNHLDGAIAGSFQATDGTWLLGTDFLYAKVSAGRDFRFGGGSADFDQEQFLLTVLGGIRVPMEVQNLQVFATAGLRYQHYAAELTIDPERLGQRRIEGTQDWVDPIIGLSARYDFAPRWFATASVDVGGFGISSDFTTQDTVAIGYEWSDSFSSSVGYRVLYTDYSDDGFKYDATQHGLILTSSLKF